MKGLAATLSVILVALTLAAASASAISKAAIVAEARAAAEGYFARLEQFIDDAHAQETQPPQWEWVRGDVDAVLLSSACTDTSWSAEVLVGQLVGRAPYLSTYVSDFVQADLVVVSVTSQGHTALEPVEHESLTPGIVEALNDTSAATLEMSNTAAGRVALALDAFRQSDSMKQLLSGSPGASWPESELKALLYQGDSSHSRFYVVRLMEDPDSPGDYTSAVAFVIVAFPQYISLVPVRLVPRDPGSVVGDQRGMSPN